MKSVMLRKPWKAPFSVDDGSLYAGFDDGAVTAVTQGKKAVDGNNSSLRDDVCLKARDSIPTTRKSRVAGGPTRANR